MKTEETNKIIAEFMGNRNYLYNNDKSSMYFILTNTAGEELIVNYDNDWGLLMEVVEKIAPLISESEFKYRIGNDLLSVNKEGVYNACVEFIKWYNGQKSA